MKMRKKIPNGKSFKDISLLMSFLIKIVIKIPREISVAAIDINEDKANNFVKIILFLKVKRLIGSEVI